MKSADNSAEHTLAVRKMFSAIAPTYDLLNRVLSFGIDVRWRREMVDKLPKGELSILDLACGTGDVAIEIVRRRPQARVAGADLSPPMLTAAKPKVVKWKMDDAITLTAASGEELPYADGVFDGVTIAFGIRNVTNRDRALMEMHRVLKPGGQALILDFSIPPNPLVRVGYGFYFHRVLPLLGGLVSGNYEAYKYLPRSVEGFPPRDEFASLMEECGFSKVEWKDFTFGVATLYEGTKS